ncbi:ribosomal protein S18-alanine N-acetyltransferase [Candidatus Enterococcus ferrettii]|uniref:[Ribosomal protein bS18]-alanine N-acetyltransferase n=1 Tax=Candidatus Enterococcus ferrettii TaxID=2815324 RepID=A0ABV0EYM3_9ENTE|nr:ribosomal protein S18-alanine N-acetyltransferase [Enterococcus sp. 665A]MBO1339956.1 ribosomal protein S18-alanine N-acetyltransferase [Enterococcus sp. 665A]
MNNETQLKQLSQQLWKINTAAHGGTSPWKVTEFYTDLQQKHSHYLLEEKSVPIAFLGFHQVLDEIEITNIATLPDYKRQGMAERLFGRLFEHACQEKVAQIFLEVRASNLAAYRLYAKMNFEVISERKNYYYSPVEDALIMRWKAGSAHGNE